MTKDNESGKIRNGRGRPSYTGTSQNPADESAAPVAGSAIQAQTASRQTSEINDDSRSRFPKRVPLHEQQRLGAKKRAGYQPRIFNDEGNKIQAALDAGYSIVNDGRTISGHRSCDPGKFGNAATAYVGRNERGHEITGVLMEIPQNWYDEDQAAKQMEIDAQEQQIRQGMMETGNISPNKYGSVSMKSVKGIQPIE